MTGPQEQEAREALAAVRDAVERLVEEKPPMLPVRQRSANGSPPAFSESTRRCRRCSACFIDLAPGKTGERGLWGDMGWWCSQECWDIDHGRNARD